MAGDTLVYVLTWSNDGPSDASGVTALDSLPSGVTFLSASGGGSESGGVVTWPAFSLAVGVTRVDTVRVVAPVEGTYVNVARISSPLSDADPTDDRATTSATLGASADLGVGKVLAAPATPLAGDTLTYVVTVSNAGPSAATAVALVDSLPSGVVFVSATNGAAHAGGVVTWPTFGLAAGTSRADTVRAVAPVDGVVANVARVTSATSDPGGG